MRDHTHERAAAEKLWTNPDFLKLWAGQGVSLIGSQVSLLALPLTAVLALKASVFQVGLLGAAEYAPFLLVTLFAGVWVDRRARRPILIVADLGRALLLGAIPALALTGRLTMAALLVIALLVGTLTVFFHLAYQSFLPTLIGRHQLARGNSVLVATESVAEIGGPGLAGALVQLLTAPVAIVVDACSYVVSVASLCLIHTPERIAPRARGESSLWRDMREGFRAVFGNPVVRAFQAEAASYNFLSNGYSTIFVVYVIRELRFSPLLYGLLFGVGSVGGLLGATITTTVARRIGVGRTITLGGALGCLPMLAVPLAGGPHALVVGVLMAAFFVNGVGVTATNVYAVSLRQAMTPDHLLGRMNASYRVITYGSIPLGALAGGLLGAWLGPRPALAIICGLFAFVWLWLRFSPIHQLQTMPGSPTEESGTVVEPDAAPAGLGREEIVL